MATMNVSATGLGQVARTLLRPELALVVLMAVIIGMLIVPLPTFLVDLLIGVNLMIAIVIFLSSFYVERILNFSTFPSVLLFTTLMRLALSVSTSRLILVDADAGHIVSAFGEFVVADNLVVGFVIFAIVTVVQADGYRCRPACRVHRRCRRQAAPPRSGEGEPAVWFVRRCDEVRQG